MKAGDLMQIIKVPDQSPWVSERAGKACLLINDLGKNNHKDFRAPGMWEILIDGEIMFVHRLDLGEIDESR